MILQCGSYTLDFSKKTYIMGIVNVTPDSFSDGGMYTHLDHALFQVERLLKDGADIIDIGGESTRPGSDQVQQEDELSRVIPVIEKIKQNFDVPISIDTYKAEVAKQAIRVGAVLINDVWGAKADAKMAEVAAKADLPIILMHNRQEQPYQNLVQEVISELQESISLVQKAGVRPEKIILDPGIGFAKSVNENLELMRNLTQIIAQGYPVLLGTSRKSMIGKTLDLPVDDRLEGTIASNCFGISQGCQIIRVHDVKEVARAARMMDAMMGKFQMNE